MANISTPTNPYQPTPFDILTGSINGIYVAPPTTPPTTPTPSFNNIFAIISKSNTTTTTKQNIISLITSIQANYVLLISNINLNSTTKAFNIVCTMISQFDNLRIILEPLYTNNSYTTITTQPPQNLQTLLTNAKKSALKGIQDASGVYFNNTTRPNKQTYDIQANNLVSNATGGVNTSTFSSGSSPVTLSAAEDIKTTPDPTKTAAAPLGYYVQLARSIYIAITTSATTLANISPSIATATTVFNAMPKNRPAFTFKGSGETLPMVNPTLTFNSNGSGMLAP